MGGGVTRGVMHLHGEGGVARGRLTTESNMDLNSLGQFRRDNRVSLRSLAGVTVTLSIRGRLRSLFGGIPFTSVRRMVGRRAGWTKDFLS